MAGYNHTAPMQYNTKLTRRLFLAATAASAAAACGPAIGKGVPTYSAKTTPLRPLKDAFNFRVGCAIQSHHLKNIQGYRQLLAEHFNQVTPEYEAQLPIVQPDINTQNWDGVDMMANVADAEGMWLHMHALLWHEVIPKYLVQMRDNPRAFQTFTDTHIRTIMNRYRNQARSWDVINEPIENNTGKLRESALYDGLGADFIKYALDAAHKADPNALLFINEYDLETDPKKFDGFMRVVADVQKSGAPLHGLGTQMHTDIHVAPSDMDASLRRLAETGLKVHISELDISLNPKKRQSFTVTDGHIRAQAHMAHQIFKSYAALPQRAQFAITLWGLGDSVSWLKHFKPQARPDAPLLFDEEWQPKSALYGALAAGQTPAMR